MAIEFTQERFYPSVRKPGVFFIDNEEDTQLWEQLTGIDNSAIDRFKFSLGSWVDVSNSNQKIILYPISIVNDDTFENIKGNLIGPIFGEQPRDVFVGIPIVSKESNLQINKDDLSFLSKDILPIYHVKQSSDYNNTTAPLTIQFGVNYFKRFNQNIDNVLVRAIGQDVFLPNLSFQTDISNLNKTQRIFSNFDWYNDTVWRGGGGPSSPGDYEAGRHDDVISDIEGPPEDRERNEWQDSDLNQWHRFEYALPSFTGRHELTQKYVDARGTDDDVGGMIVHSLGEKIGVSLDTNDPYTNGTPDRIDNNHLGLNLEDLIGITKEHMGDAFDPSDYSATGNMTSRRGNINNPVDGTNSYFMALRSIKKGDHTIQLFLTFNPNVRCPVDLRVGDRVAFNVVDARNEAPNTVRGSEKHYLHRGRRLSRPPLGVGRQFEYTITGFEVVKDTTYGNQVYLNKIFLDVFIKPDGHFQTGASDNQNHILFLIYTNDILKGSELSGVTSIYNPSSNADIIQIYRREDDFDEDDNNIPSIAHKDKLYLFHRQQSGQDIEDWAQQYDVIGNPDKAIQFNTHGRFGLSLTNSYFKDMPMVDEFLQGNDDRASYKLHNDQAIDPLRLSDTRLMGFYLQPDEDTSYARAGVNSLLKLENLSSFRNNGQSSEDNPISRLKGTYTTKAVVANASANVDHYSYRAFNYRYMNRRKQNEIDENFGALGFHSMFKHMIGWIAINGYNGSEVGTGNVYGRLAKHTLQEKTMNGVQLAASKNVNNNNLDAGGYSTVSSIPNSELTLPEAGRNYRRNLVYNTRIPCDFFIKYKMNDSDFEESVLPGQESVMEIDLDDYNSRITDDGYVKISKSNWYQIIPDITVYNDKESDIMVTVGVGAKKKGIADKNYLSSYNEKTFRLEPSDKSWWKIHKRLGGINKSPNGDNIRITDGGRYNRSNGDPAYKHLTSKYFTAIQEDESVIPFIRLSWRYNTTQASGFNFESIYNGVYFVLGHIDMIELPYDFNAGTTPQDLMSNYVKYHVLDWGDSSEPMTEDKIRQSEFFSIYEQEPDDIDKFQVKNLMQTVEIAKPIYEDGILNLTSHTYTEPGVKNIKTLIFKLDEAGTAIYETIVMNTSIVVNSVGSLLQDFNAYGASDFNVLPLSNTKKELIIGGGVSSDSNYVSSLQAIDDNNLYESNDYNEKEYYEDFQNTLLSGSFGEDVDRLDLSTVRFFNKPKSLYDFITDDIDSLIDNDLVIENLPINSSATDIFINNDDCKFELDMSNPSGVLIENSSGGRDGLFGILMGDYSLIKEAGEKIKKEDEMEIPEVEIDNSKQAF